MEPILVTGLAVLMLRERVSPVVTLLVVAVTVGAIVVMATPGAHGSPAGVALTLAAVVACAFYTALTRRLILDDGSLIVVLGQQPLALTLVTVWLTFAMVATSGGAAGTRTDAATLLLGATSGVVYYGGTFAWSCKIWVSRSGPANVEGCSDVGRHIPAVLYDAGMMLLFRRKMLSGSYFALILPRRSRFLPKALSTPTVIPSSTALVKFRYSVPVPCSCSSAHAPRTQEMTLSSSFGSDQLPSIDSIQFAERSL
jgi:hypothetical protein